jgi:phosphonate transport system substrate-binding protein
MRLPPALLAVALVAAACGGDGSSDRLPPAGWPESIVLGLVPGVDRADILDSVEPFIDALEDTLGIHVEPIVLADDTALAAAMSAGTVDIGPLDAFAYVLSTEASDDLVAVSQLGRFGAFTFHGQWFTDDETVCLDPPVEGTALVNGVDGIEQIDALDARNQQVGITFTEDGRRFGAVNDRGDPIIPGWSCIGDLGAVAGETVAFVGRGSRSSYLFPALQLLRLGIDPTTDIDPIFTGSQDSTVAAVYDGEARFGVSFDDARRRIEDAHPDVGRSVIVFHITDEVPYDVIAARGDLPVSLRNWIGDAIAEYLDTPDGAELLDEVLGWTGVRPAVESDFDVVREAVGAFDLAEPPG